MKRTDQRVVAGVHMNVARVSVIEHQKVGSTQAVDRMTTRIRDTDGDDNQGNGGPNSAVLPQQGQPKQD